MRIAIIGGGAAGLMAAATIHETCPHTDIFLIERNKELGKKVMISGGGRCNVTTGFEHLPTVLGSYPRGGKFLSSAMHQFPPSSVYLWFETHGVPLKTEEDLRVFPKSNKGKDVVDVFNNLFTHSHVSVLLEHHATRVEKKESHFVVTLKNGKTLETDVLVLTTGGQAYRHTGSTGDGYAFAETLGHTITPLAPSLNSFFTVEVWPKELSGLSFERATMTAIISKKPLPSTTGPFLFTHTGLSGPAVFALSSLVAFEPYDRMHPLLITIHLFPDLTLAELESKISILIKENPKKSMGNILAMIVPKSLSEVLCKETDIDEHKRAIEVAKKDIASCALWLTRIPLHVNGRGAGDEFVTAGGIPLSEVNPKTMESNITPNLYFAGEILDVDGYTGGFNLQASWATGRLAGEAIAKKC